LARSLPSLKVSLTLLGSAAVLIIAVICYEIIWGDADIYVPMFAVNCSECHGNDLKGTALGPALVSRYLAGGDNIAALMHSIRNQPAHQTISDSLSDNEVKGLAIYVGEKRLGQTFTEFRYADPIKLPSGTVTSNVHNFAVEVFADELNTLPYAIAPLPDGRWLLTERENGLRLINASGEPAGLVQGMPATGGTTFTYRGLAAGVGWLLDVAPHPRYVQNGWVYLHYTELCETGCTGASRIFPASMNKLIRGRIRDGEWADAETLWQAPPRFYSTFTDTAAGGRLAFDDSGHVYISVGFKEPLGLGAQDLYSPYGKIHRINDDGSVPPDNPFVINAGNDPDPPFFHQTIWTYGHRTPQGLEWNPVRQTVWNAEMGPRGGDEINELLPGRNYGWPYHSLGLEYTGTQVARNRLKDVEFDVEQVEQTLVDFTPSPALSSFTFYRGDAFPGWHDNLLLGTLKGSSLYRLEFDGNQLIQREVVINDLGRIRDIEIGVDGLPYLLIENEAGSMIVRLRPEESPAPGSS